MTSQKRPMPKSNAIHSFLSPPVLHRSLRIVAHCIECTSSVVQFSRILIVAIVSSVDRYQDRLIAPRRLSRRWRKAWNPQKTKKPCNRCQLLSHCSQKDSAYKVYEHSAENSTGDCASVLWIFFCAHHCVATRLCTCQLAGFG